ncbi:transmembrane protein, putative [Medicago truncatula]|uniref:Transmembrane protein, putative n=1 Tax=Medicago truncatula TaxID=3880 RepID=A0A072TFP2_MEDTR|nr:transmembrane protein, putative [Medicago truncatula]
MVLSALTCLGMIRQVFRLNLGIEKFKLGFLSEKCQTPESHQFELATTSSLLAIANTLFAELVIASRVARLTSYSVAIFVARDVVLVLMWLCCKLFYVAVSTVIDD